MDELNVCSWHRDEPAPSEETTRVEGVKRPPRAEPKAAPAAAIVDEKMRITCQHRQARAMVYDLRAGQRALEVRIQEPAASTDSWGAALLLKRDDGAPPPGHAAPLQGAGPTRRLAVEALERSSGNVLNAQEWEGLREALTAVRAI